MREPIRERRFTATRAMTGLLLCLFVSLLAGCGITYGGERPFTRQTTIAPTAPPSTVPKAAAPQLGAREAFLLNSTTNEIYLNQNGDEPMAMASTTKIMTALVALQFGKLDQQITIANDAVALQSNGNSVADLKAGDALTLNDLLYGLMLPSGDDAAIAVADGVAGSTERFVALMNLEAALLGLHHTHYVNVHGLDAAGHVTSARDLARLAGYAMGNTTFARIVATPELKLAATNVHHAYDWVTTNELLSVRAYDGTLGIKTGHTGDAGYCLVFEVMRQQGRLIGVVLGDDTSAERFSDAVRLLNWGYGVS